MSSNSSSSEIYSHKADFKLKGPNPYKMGFPEQITYCQFFVLLDSISPYTYWSFFFSLEKIEGELEGSGQKEKDGGKSGTSEGWRKREETNRDKIGGIKWGKLNCTWFYTMCIY